MRGVPGRGLTNLKLNDRRRSRAMDAMIPKGRIPLTSIARFICPADWSDWIAALAERSCERSSQRQELLGADQLTPRFGSINAAGFIARFIMLKTFGILMLLGGVFCMRPEPIRAHP